MRLPSFCRRQREGGRAKQRPGELTNEAILALMHGGESTHPVFASLDHPLFRLVAVAQLQGDEC